MKINKMLAEYEKHRNKKYSFKALDMDTIHEESKDNFERMANIALDLAIYRAEKPPLQN